MDKYIDSRVNSLDNDHRVFVRRVDWNRRAGIYGLGRHRGVLFESLDKYLNSRDYCLDNDHRVFVRRVDWDSGVSE